MSPESHKTVVCVCVSSEMRMVRWMCDVKVKDRISNKEIRKRLRINDIIPVLEVDLQN